jgi:wyosine [tRNA(Phe)-imidazoG37] synthetase (radical SAM superfamily)
MAYQIFRQRSAKVECLLGYEGNEFAFTGNVEDDLLSIISVHPMRKDGVMEFLKNARAGWEVVRSLIRESKLIEVEYLGSKYYIRKF